MSEVVEVEQGTVSGSLSGGVRAFLGIPYAAAPIGELRMRRPAPPVPFAGVYDATAPGATAPKSPYPRPFDTLFNEPVIDGDDYLNLNIWSPVGAANNPVLVWIHGGAYCNGSGIVPQYDGTSFARDGVVCVTINYRLVAEGFLDVGDDDCNLGLRDQIAALQWVQRNIAAFGGDPSRVTIAGESAGAMSVTSLLSSPLAAGLFHRVIPQSGAGHHALDRASAQLISAELATRLGVPADRAAIAALPRQQVIEAQSQVVRDMALNPDPARWGTALANGMAFEPTVDGDVLPALPIASIAAGRGAGIDVLVGSNLHEHRLFLVPSGVFANAEHSAADALLAANGITPQQAADAYPRSLTPGERLEKVMTDWMFAIPAIRLAEAVGANGGSAYLYEFAWETPLFDGALRSCHYLEVPYVFGTLDAPGSDALVGPAPDRDLAARMHAAWVAFITDGEPGWPAYGASRATQRFGTTDELLTDPAQARRELWEGTR